MGQKNSKNGSIAINEKTTKEERNTSRKSETVTAATEHGAKKEKNKGDEQGKAGPRSETVTIAEHLAKYIIGTGGATIREIEQKSGARLKVEDGGRVAISAESDRAVQEAKKLVLAVCKEHEHKMDLSNAVSKTFAIPNHLHKYAIGEGGKHIQGIQKRNASRIELSGDQCTISAQKESAIDKSFSDILKAMKEYGWHYDSDKKSFYERNRVGEFADKARAPAHKAAEQRNKCFEESKRAFESGDKAKAKKLSEEGHAHDAKFRELQKQACKKIFEFVNKGNPVSTVDLHGLQVEEALDIVKQRISQLQKKGDGELTVITGAGLHSDKNGPKIKPAIMKMLSEELKLQYTETNHGELAVEF